MSRYYVRVRTKEQLNIVMNWRQADVILMDYTLMDCADAVIASAHAEVSDNARAAREKTLDDQRPQFYYCLPYVARQNRLESIEQIISRRPGGTGMVICNMDELAMLTEMGFQGDVIADPFLYAYNSDAIDFYREYYPGMKFILSDELTDREISGIARIQDERRMDSFIYKIYGHQPLMITAQCISRNYTGCSKKAVPFKDERGNHFCAVSQCSQCYSIIYNEAATSMIDKMSEIGFKNLMIDFTIESADQVKRILALIMQEISCNAETASDRAEYDNNRDSSNKQSGGQDGSRQENMPGAFHKTADNKGSIGERSITRGHHYRGVD